ncbi:hypothetical protein FRB91_003711 [Serendipita sp. 411]|nr:hypothetical protein FRB91_003711 [Serendipita sp. 411]
MAVITLRATTNSTAISSNSVGTTSDDVLNLWLAFHILAGHILLPILVFIFTYLSKRHPTLVNLCFTWIFTSICSCFLLYADRERGRKEPAFDLCLTQASLLYGTTPLTSVACLAMVYQVWSSVYGGGGQNQDKEDEQSSIPWQLFKPKFLLAAPWIMFSIWATAAAWLGFHNPDKISRSRRFFYCSLDFDPFSSSISVFCAAILLVTMFFEASIGVSLVRNWRAVRSGITSGRVEISMLVRVICFGVYVFIGLVLSVLSIKAPASPVPDLWLASVGLSIVLIFGTQRNIWVAISNWRPRRQWKEKAVDLTS